MARKNKPNPVGPTADAILMADRHLSLRQPICRTDDFVGAMMGKLKFIRQLQLKHGDCPILDAGDFFDHWFLDRGEQRLFTMILPYIYNVIGVLGQHDLPQHNLELYRRTNFAVLAEVGRIVLVQGKDIRKNIHIAGFSWGEELTEGGGSYLRNVALVHRMTYPRKPPYPGAENDGGTAKALLRKMKGYDLVVTGDNHETFACREGDRLLVNPGSMMRMTAKQEEHEPCVFLWFAEGNTVEKIVLPHEKGVVSREHIDQKQERDDRIAAWVERIGHGEVELGLGFRENVERHIRKHKIPDAITDIVRRAME